MIATLEDLLELGMERKAAEIAMMAGSLAFCCKDNGKVFAAFGIAFLVPFKGEVWAAFSPDCPMVAVLRLAKLFKKIVSIVPPCFVFGALKAPGAVAFEKLALMCGFNLVGEIDVNGEIMEAAFLGGEIG